MTKTRIMIVDDHPLLRRGLSLLLNQEADMMVCGEYNTAEEALARFEQDLPDLVIMDITMSASGMTGFDFIKQIRVQQPKLFVLVLSIHEECIYAERSVKAGANGYLLKQEPAEKVVAALHQVMLGNLVLSEKILQALLRRYLTDAASDTGPDVGRLSNREYEVLRLIGEGMQPQQIAEKLEISTKTVETHRFNIRKKLHFRRASELIQFAIRHVHNGEPIY